MADLKMSKDKVDFSQKPNFINQNTVPPGKGASTPTIPRDNNGITKPV